jgi:hypothetical protein
MSSFIALDIEHLIEAYRLGSFSSFSTDRRNEFSIYGEELDSETDSINLPSPAGTPLLQRIKKARDADKDNWDNSVSSLTSVEFRKEGERQARIREQGQTKNRPGQRLERVRKTSTHSLNAGVPSHRSQNKRMSVPTIVVHDLPIHSAPAPAPVRANSVKNKPPPINLRGIVEEAEEDTNTKAHREWKHTHAHYTIGTYQFKYFL